MKKSYIKPQAQAVCLFTEDTMLAGSTTFEVNAGKDTDVIMSEGKGWSSDNWTATDED